MGREGTRGINHDSQAQGLSGWGHSHAIAPHCVTGDLHSLSLVFFFLAFYLELVPIKNEENYSEM